jgi:hypothetical protein
VFGGTELGETTMKYIMSLHDDEVGSVYTMEVVFSTLLLVFGMLAGLTSYRDGVAQELGDTAVAIESIDQSFTYDLVTAGGGTVTRTFSDTTTLTDPAGAPPAGLSITTPASSE